MHRRSNLGKIIGIFCQKGSIIEKIYFWLDRKFEAWVNLEFSRFANRIISSCKFSTGAKFSMQESYYKFFSTSTVNDLNLVCTLACSEQGFEIFRELLVRTAGTCV